MLYQAYLLIYSTYFLNILTSVNAFYDVFKADELQTKLWGDKGQNYNPDLIPINNGSTLIVEAGMSITEIVQFDSVNQALSLTVWFFLLWNDVRLTWNPEDYGGVEEITVSPTEIWKPDITLYNSADGKHQFSEDMGNQVHANLWFDGYIDWIPITLYTISCPMKLKYFPFDVQMCTMDMASWVHLNSSLMYIDLTSNKVNTNRYTKNNIWYLEDTVALSLIDGTGSQELKFFFILSRNYSQYLISVVLTCSLLVFLCFLSFWIPTGAGERLSLSLTVIVALSVYQLLAATLVPLGTDHMPILVIFLAVLVLLVNFSVVITMANLKIVYAIQVEGPPRWLFTVLVNYFGKVIRVHRYYEFKNYLKAKEKVEEDKSKRDESLENQPGGEQDTEQDYTLNAKEKLADVEWDLISLTMDRLCMILYAIIFLGMLIWLFLNMDSKRNQIKQHYKEIMSFDKNETYNCEYRKDSGDLYDEEYEQLFCVLK